MSDYLNSLLSLYSKAGNKVRLLVPDMKIDRHFATDFKDASEQSRSVMSDFAPYDAAQQLSIHRFSAQRVRVAAILL